MAAGSRAGINARYIVHGPDGKVLITDRAGFFDHTVPPGGHVDLNLPVPALSAVGRHRLYVDLEARKVSFTQYGSEALIYDWDARDPARPRGQ